MVPYFLTGSMERKPLTALLAGLCLLLVVHFVRGNLGALKHTYLAQEEGITARVVSFEHGNDIALNDEAVKTLDKGEYMDIPTTVNRDAVMTSSKASFVTTIKGGRARAWTPDAVSGTIFSVPSAYEENTVLTMTCADKVPQ